MIMMMAHNNNTTTTHHNNNSSKEEEEQKKAHENAFMEAAINIRDSRLSSFHITNPIILRCGAYLVNKSLYNISINGGADDDDEDVMEAIADQCYRRLRSLLCVGESTIMHGRDPHGLLLTPWSTTPAYNMLFSRPAASSALLAPWDALHISVERGGGAALDLRCRLILGALARTGRCDFNAFHDGKMSPLRFAVERCGPKTVRVLVHLEAAFAPNEEENALDAIAAAPLDVLLAFAGDITPLGIPDLHRRIAARPDGGTLLHAVVCHPQADERHLRVVLCKFEGDVRRLDDALRSPLEALRRLHPASPLVPLLERLEADAAAEQQPQQQKWRAAATLAVARHKGLPRELGRRLARQLRVAV
jgi:hypothetical protein